MSLDGIDGPYHERKTRRGDMPKQSTEAARDEAGALPKWRATAGDRAGRFEGAAHGSEVSFFVVHVRAGEGPALHSPPYSETFVVLAGRARFELSARSVEAAAGDVVVAPAGTPHMFRAVGSEALEMVNIHAAPRMETTWLEARQP
jgi:mannose-6-phosphate isomerase-like protein (cupin superfamily)